MFEWKKTFRNASRHGVNVEPHIVVQHVESIKRQFIKYRQEVIDLQEAQKLETIKLATKLKNVQMACQHWCTSFYPDPAGGSDSYTQCDLCGKRM